ncbi:hypothetical protein, partial [Leuconostoc mesenteroides]|uniref:hypothetical protein n=1 Tax=Leuconostoc mesenteroides TaxID=1245 RepID=UPI001EE6983C
GIVFYPNQSAIRKTDWLSNIQKNKNLGVKCIHFTPKRTEPFLISKKHPFLKNLYVRGKLKPHYKKFKHPFSSRQTFESAGVFSCFIM